MQKSKYRTKQTSVATQDYHLQHPTQTIDLWCTVWRNSIFCVGGHGRLKQHQNYCHVIFLTINYHNNETDKDNFDYSRNNGNFIQRSNFNRMYEKQSSPCPGVTFRGEGILKPNFNLLHPEKQLCLMLRISQGMPSLMAVSAYNKLRDHLMSNFQ